MSSGDDDSEADSVQLAPESCTTDPYGDALKEFKQKDVRIGRARAQFDFMLDRADLLQEATSNVTGFTAPSPEEARKELECGPHSVFGGELQTTGTTGTGEDQKSGTENVTSVNGF